MRWEFFDLKPGSCLVNTRWLGKVLRVFRLVGGWVHRPGEHPQGHVPGRKIRDKSVQWSHPAKKVKQQKCIDLILLTLDVIWWYENKHTKKCHARCIRTIPSDIYSEVFEWRNLKRNQFQNFSCIQICLKPTWYLSLPWSPLAFPKKKQHPSLGQLFSPAPGTRLLGLSLHFLPRSARCHGTDGSTA